MATYRTNPANQHARGLLGGVVWRTGDVNGQLSSRPVGGRSNLGLVNGQLKANESARREWGKLSDAERESWQAMSQAYQTSFGFSEPSNLSGHALYLRTATALMAAGVTSPPSFAALQVLGRRQAIPVFHPRSSANAIDVWWGRNLQGDWLPGAVWTRLRVGDVQPASRKRPVRSVRTLQHIPNSSVPFSEFGSPYTISDVPYARSEGWMRMTFASWDAFGWWSTERSVVYPVFPETAPWFSVIGSFTQEPGGSFIEYDPPQLTIRFSAANPAFIRFATVGSGSLATVGGVARWIRQQTFHQVTPTSIESSTEDASGLRPIVRQRTNVRGNPVPFVFDV